MPIDARAKRVATRWVQSRHTRSWLIADGAGEDGQAAPQVGTLELLVWKQRDSVISTWPMWEAGMPSAFLILFQASRKSPLPPWVWLLWTNDSDSSRTNIRLGFFLCSSGSAESFSLDLYIVRRFTFQNKVPNALAYYYFFLLTWVLLWFSGLVM